MRLQRKAPPPCSHWDDTGAQKDLPVPLLTNSLYGTISIKIKACGVRTRREWSFSEEIISKQSFKNIHKPLSQDKCVSQAGREEDGGGGKGDRLQLETAGGGIRHFENNGIIVTERTDYSLQSKTIRAHKCSWGREEACLLHLLIWLVGSHLLSRTGVLLLLCTL